jgi:hypothetical protein
MWSYLLKLSQNQSASKCPGEKVPKSKGREAGQALGFDSAASCLACDRRLVTLCTEYWKIHFLSTSEELLFHPSYGWKGVNQAEVTSTEMVCLYLEVTATTSNGTFLPHLDSSSENVYYQMIHHDTLLFFICGAVDRT